MNVQDVSLSTISIMDVHGVSISSIDVQDACIPFINTMCIDVPGVSLSPTPSVLTCRVYPFSSPRMDALGVSVSTASSMDVHCLRLPSYIT
jgi:hypothetical protein